MNKYLVITIDVEPDCSPTWQYSNPLTFRGVSEGIKNKLQPLFNKYGITPTYLINNVVLENDESINTFLNLEGKFELGTHLHSEFIEPQKMFKDYAGKKGEANQCDLPPEIEFNKLKNITELFENKFNRKPFSFRAGRFSAGKNTISCLEKLGYKVDTSVTPHVKWQGKTRNNPVDYSNVPEQPYFISEKSFPKKDDEGNILEVPVSIKPEKFLFWNKPQWLRPFSSDYNLFVAISKWHLQKFSHEKILVYNMMFHNVEVLPGLSPYPQTESECKDYVSSIEKYFIYCKEQNIKSVGLSDFADIYGREK